jgi:hypothetical protein
MTCCLLRMWRGYLVWGRGWKRRVCSGLQFMLLCDVAICVGRVFRQIGSGYHESSSSIVAGRYLSHCSEEYIQEVKCTATSVCSRNAIVGAYCTTQNMSSYPSNAGSNICEIPRYTVSRKPLQSFLNVDVDLEVVDGVLGGASERLGTLLEDCEYC